MKAPVYLDYNATTPISKEVVKEMMLYLRTNFGNPSSGYESGRLSKEAIEQARLQVANLIAASPEEIIFTSGGTESNNHAIRGAALANAQKGKHIITSAVEHPAVTEVCNYLEEQGYEITWLPVDSFGKVNPADVEKAVRPDTVLITIMHANNEVGTIQPLEEIAAIARKNDILFHTDAAQSVGKIETDVNTLGVDMLSLAGHKLYAPKGIGALYIRNGVKVDNLIYGAGQENGKRPGTENVPYCVGLGKACELAKNSLEISNRNMFRMRERLLNGLKEKSVAEIKLNADLNNCLPNTLSISFEETEAHLLASLLSKDVYVSTRSACHTNSSEISQVLKAMNVEPKVAAGTVRFSVGKYTTEEEIDHAVEAISNAVSNFSNSKLTFNYTKT